MPNVNSISADCSSKLTRKRKIQEMSTENDDNDTSDSTLKLSKLSQHPYPHSHFPLSHFTPLILFQFQFQILKFNSKFPNSTAKLLIIPKLYQPNHFPYPSFTHFFTPIVFPTLIFPFKFDTFPFFPSA